MSAETSAQTLNKHQGMTVGIFEEHASKLEALLSSLTYFSTVIA
jgi:hypothetical protein